MTCVKRLDNIFRVPSDPHAMLLDIVLDPNSIDTGFISSGPTGAVLPEPSTPTLVGLGLTALVAFRRRSVGPQSPGMGT